MDELTFKEICKCWWSSVIKPAARKASKDSFKIKFRGTYNKIIASGIAALYNAFTHNNFSELLGGFKMKVLEILVVAIGAWLVISIIECIFRFFYNLIEIPASFAKKIKDISFQKDHISKILATALEVECPKDVSIQWNPIFGSVITVRENNSQNLAWFDWNFTLKNIKKETIRSLKIKWEIDINVNNLMVEIDSFLKDLSEKVTRGQTINDLKYLIAPQNTLTTVQKRKDGTNTFIYYLSNTEEDSLNSIPESGKSNLGLPKNIADTLMFYSIILSQKIDSNNNFIILPLPVIKLNISYFLEEKNSKISQTFFISGKIASCGKNAVGLTSLVITFDKVDYDKQLIDVEKNS